MAHRSLTSWLVATATMLVAAAVGALGATRPSLPVAVMFTLAVVAALTLAQRYPHQALTCGVFALLIASTKFRQRSSSASLAGEVDGQIIMELAVYALFVLTVAVAAWTT